MTETGIVVDVAVLAHQEEATVASAIRDLADQTAMSDPRIDVKVRLLANGCTDRTVERAQAAVAELNPQMAANITIHEIPQAGKSRTMQRFLHSLSRPEAEILIFVDADIRLVRQDTLARMIGALHERSELHVFVSRPVKDVNYFDLETGVTARLIAAGADGLDDYRTAICGQLFAIRSSAARKIHLPAGLPVEDGFIRAMVLTDFLSGREQLDRIDGDPAVFHVYESIRTIPELVRHQTRIVTGSAINAALFGRMRRVAPTEEEARRFLVEAARDDGWLTTALREELPRAPFGYVPFHFLTKRLRNASLSRMRRPKAVAAFIAGIGLDAAAYVLATLRLRGGRAAGFW